MKKLIAALMALVMLCCGFAMAETATDVTGTWYASLAGMVVTLELNPDGTVLMDVAGMGSNEGVWEIEGDTLYINRGQEDETLLNVNADGTLADPDGMMNFGREPIAAIELPGAVPAADISAFNGTWSASIINAFGMTLDMETAMAEGLGMMLGVSEEAQDLTMVIDNGSVAIFGSEAIAMNFVDGHLESIFEDEEMTALNQYVRVMEDGSLCYELMGMQIYFNKAE